MTVPRAPSSEELEQIRSLNRLFLDLLQGRARRKSDCLGLPEGAWPLLAGAEHEQLDAVAQFPRALFSLSLDEEPAPRIMELSAVDSTRYAVDITLLLGAWSFSRHNLCQARFLLGLEPRTIQRLRSLPLADLARFAELPSLLRCAFADNPWLWQELLSTRHAEDRRRLALIALQPGTSNRAARRGAVRTP